MGFYADSAEASKPEDVEDVFGAGGPADDVLSDGLRGVGLLEFGDGTEGVEDFGGLVTQDGRQSERLIGLDGSPGRDLGDGGGVDAGVLTDIQRL